MKDVTIMMVDFSAFSSFYIPEYRIESNLVKKLLSIAVRPIIYVSFNTEAVRLSCIKNEAS